MNKEKQDELEELKKQYEILEEEQNFVRKARQQMEVFMDEWRYYCREEQDVLGEIAHISVGTPSDQKANLALVNQESQNNHSNRLFETFYEDLSDYQKKIARQQLNLEEEIITRKWEVSKDAEN